MTPLEDGFLFVFPFLFVGMWLIVALCLSRASGWPALSDAFPDRADETLIGFGAASGQMGIGVSYNACLVITACRQGLRIGVWRIFSPFDRPFFVPWGQLTCERTRGLLGQRVTLRFGRPPIGHLQISSRLANKLAVAAGANWPERSIGSNATVS